MYYKFTAGILEYIGQFSRVEKMIIRYFLELKNNNNNDKIELLSSFINVVNSSRSKSAHGPGRLKIYSILVRGRIDMRSAR